MCSYDPRLDWRNHRGICSTSTRPPLQDMHPFHAQPWSRLRPCRLVTSQLGIPQTRAREPLPLAPTLPKNGTTPSNHARQKDQKKKAKVEEIGHLEREGTGCPSRARQTHYHEATTSKALKIMVPASPEASISTRVNGAPPPQNKIVRSSPRKNRKEFLHLFLSFPSHFSSCILLRRL